MPDTRVVKSLIGCLALAFIGCQQAPSPAATTAPAPTTAPAKPAASPLASPAASPVASPAASPVAKPAASPSPALAVASPSPAGGRVVSFDAVDYSFTLPDTLPAGQVTLVMRNAGKETHHAQLLRLNTGVTIDQFLAAFRQNEVAGLSLTSLEGGTGALDPGPGTEEVTLDLKEGNYAVVCFITSPDGIPHVAKGMIKPLQVTAAPSPGAAPQPAARVTITLKDFTFDNPDTLPSGRNTWRITNQGPQPHELQVAKLAAGKTLTDLQSFFATTPPPGPPPFQSMGGFQAISANESGFLTLDVPAGDYAFYCAVPDPSTGKRHLEEGMIKQVTLR